MINNHAKRVNIVSLKMIKESSVLYGNRRISRSDEAVELLKNLLEDSDRERLVVCCLNTKNEPTS